MSETDSFFKFLRGEIIQIPLKAGQWPVSETPFDIYIYVVTMAGRWWPNIEFWFGTCSFVVFRGSGPVLLGNPYSFGVFFQECVLDPRPPPFGVTHETHLKFQVISLK